MFTERFGENPNPYKKILLYDGKFKKKSSEKGSPGIRKMAPSFSAPSYYPDEKLPVSDSDTEINLVAISAIFAEF